MRRVKKVFCWLCCMLLVVSMTIDVKAAEELGSLLNETAAQEQADEGGDKEELEETQTPPGAQEEGEGNGEETAGTETPDGAEPDGSGEKEDVPGTGIPDNTGADGEGESGEIPDTDSPDETEEDKDGESEGTPDTETQDKDIEEIGNEGTESSVENHADEDTREVEGNYILDDVYVSNMSGKDDTNYSTSETLIFGKFRHVYLRFDLADIDADAERIVFQGTWAKGTRTAVVVTECSEYLRTNDSENSGEKWTKENITYNNRPLDIGNAIYEELPWSVGSLDIDLTDFIKGQIEQGSSTACIHFTTKTVDNDNIGAVEIQSSRNTEDAKKPKLVVTEAKLSVNNIFDDAVVRSDQPGTIYSAEKKLTIGKKRHAYLRFDLSDIDVNSEKIVFQGTFLGNASSVGEKNIVVTESSEYLRKSDSESDTEKWTMANITYNNRPLDTENVICEALKWSSGNVEIDLTDFIKDKISSGEKTACIHITTTTVDTEDSAIDLASSRTDQGDEKKPRLTAAPAVEPSVNGIFDDAYVDSSKGNENYKDKISLVFGKYRHLYFRFDLSDISADADKIVFRGTYNKGTRKPVVVTETSEYLRASDSADSTTKWKTDNITYNNRPIDKEKSIYEALEWPNSQTNLEIDLTEFVKTKIGEGAKTACVHITTTTVDQDNVAAVEVYSSRNDSGKPRLVVSTPNDERPVGLAREKAGNDYYDNGYLIQKVVKIKTSDGQYLKVQEDGTVSTTANANEAGLFGLHIYQYDKYERESYGATKTTYAFENLATGKFLTIQNYFAESDANRPYYNLENGKYIIKAAAPDVNWNERFDIQYYPDSAYYTIASHLQVYRDGSDAVSPLYVENSTLKCGKNDDSSPFYLEEVENQDKLKILQEVDGSSVTLFWKPVNGDTTSQNYQIENQTVNYDMEKKELYTQITGLAAGLHEFTVSYNGQQETVKVRIFNHMALAHSEEQLEQMAEHVRKKEEPWYSDYQRLLKQVPLHMSDASFVTSAQEGVGRGDPEGHGNIGVFEKASNAAYFNALLWVITGEEQYAKTGVTILNAWAGALKIVDGRDRILGASISTYRMNNAAEIFKYYHGGYSGYSDEDFRKYQDMLLNVIYPVVQDLGLPMKANGNWDTAAMAAMVTIGAICENTEIFERAVYLYQDIHTNGSIAVYVSEWGQSVESCRDQAHAQLGISYLADVCETAQKQGIDLYGLYDNRLARGFNWAAQYNLYNTENLKIEPLTDVFEQKKWSTVDQEKINRGELRSVYELPLAHYSKVEGVDVTWMQKAAEAMRPQGYVNNDHLNFGTLTTYNGEATKAPEPYFQLRTRLEPWYQRTWNDAKKYGEIVDNIPETLHSYFAVNESGSVTVSGKKADAPFFQLKDQGDGTYAIWCVATGKYLSIKEATESDENGNAVKNAVRADAKSVGESEKFVLKGTGASFFYLEAPGFGNRILNVNVAYADTENTSDPQNAILTLELGSRVTEDCDTVSNNERFILVYNTADVALKNVAFVVDTSELEAYINSLPEINNGDSTYTEESFLLFEQKLNAAVRCVSDGKEGKVSQNIVDEALRELKDAYSKLELSAPPVVSHIMAPVADKESGQVPAGTKITLTCGTEGASIYYTTDKSEPTKENGTLYETPIPVIEAVTIKAIAVKDGNVSEVSIFTYEVSGGNQGGEGGDDKPVTVSVPVADQPSGTELMIKGTRISLLCETEGASIYYTTDGSEPSVSNGTLYKNSIPVNRDMTIKAIAVKGDASSEVAAFTYRISVGLKIIMNGVSYVCAGRETIATNERAVYTGSAITFDVAVTNNGEVLIEGEDYVIKYANNVKVPAAQAKDSQKPRITITGKKNLRRNVSLYFDILPKSIATTEEGIYCEDTLEVVENKKAVPALYYGNQALKANKDYTMDQASRKWKLGDNESESVITLTGKGNYTGERRIKVHVMAKTDLQKFAIKLDASMSNIVYDGNSHEPQFAVYNTKDANKGQLSPEYYEVVKPADMVSAGTKKFTVVGKGIYTGCSITKSYKIKPSADVGRIKIDNSGLKDYAYNRLGVTFGEGDLVISDGDRVLKEGKDYKITYGKNKKVTESAKYSVIFLGNYKGTKGVPGQTGMFKITQANLEDLNWKAAALNKVYKKAGIYKTKVYVTVDNVLLKSSDYTVVYELSDGSVMAGGNKLDLEKVSGDVKVLITGKGNYRGTVETSYQVGKADGLWDLSKARITVVDENGRKIKNVMFDGNEQKVRLKIELKAGKGYQEITEEEYTALAGHITYVNHVYKGKATIVVNGDGKVFTGGKAAAFHIVPKDIAMKK